MKEESLRMLIYNFSHPTFVSNFFAFNFSLNNASISSFENSTVPHSESSVLHASLAEAPCLLLTSTNGCLPRAPAAGPNILPAAIFLRLSKGTSSGMSFFYMIVSKNGHDMSNIIQIRFVGLQNTTNLNSAEKSSFKLKHHIKDKTRMFPLESLIPTCSWFIVQRYKINNQRKNQETLDYNKLVKK